MTSPISNESKLANGLREAKEPIFTSYKTAEEVILHPKPSENMNDPLNWSSRKKNIMLFVVCFAGFVCAGSPVAHHQGYVLQSSEWKVSAKASSYSIIAAIAGFFGGPLCIAPLAKLVGRTSVLFWSLVVLFFCQVWGAKMTARNGYIPFVLSRWIAGMFAGLPIILGPAYIMELFFLHQRGRAFTVFEMSVLMGSAVIQTIGGFIANAHAWPLTLWWTLGPIGLSALLVFLFLEETGPARTNYPPLYSTKLMSPIGRRVSTIFPGRKVLLNCSGSSVLKAATTPVIIAFAPVTVIAGFYTLASFGWVVLIQVLLTIYLQTPLTHGGYGFSPAQNAAFSICGWVAVISAQVIGGLLSDRLPLWATGRFGGGIWRPEYRLWNMIIPALLGPIGLGIFGAGAQYHLHYMVLALGYFLVACGAILSVPVCLNYVVECFINNPTEVAIAMNCYRLVFAICLGFFVFPWEDTVGKGWMFGTAAFFDLFAALLIVVLAWQGGRMRNLTMKGLLASEAGELLISKAEIDEGRTGHAVFQ